MATIRAYTTIEQSRKLAEILPLESADMCYLSEESLFPKVNYNGMVFFNSEEEKPSTIIPCWSLAALIGVLPSRLFDSTPKRKELYLSPDLDKSYCFYRQFAIKTTGKIYLLTEGECLVDACYEMIIRLNELKLL